MTSSARPIDVLLVEDDPGDELITREAFEHNKIKNNLHVAHDGEEGLDFLYKRGAYPDAPRPDLILLDLNLPKYDGRDVHQIGIGLDLLEQLTTVVLRQVEVQQDQVGTRRVGERTAPVQEVQPLLAVVGDVQVVLDLVVLERFPGDQLVARIVLDQQHVDGSACGCHVRFPSRAAAGAEPAASITSSVVVVTIGRVKRNRVPAS